MQLNLLTVTTEDRTRSEVLRTLLRANAERLERELDAILPPVNGAHARLSDAMRYGVMGGGKRLRPFLLIQTAHMFGPDRAAIWRAAAALELIHSYSLIHDDLPCMDDDDLRRGKPSVHRAYDEAMAVLAGDALQTLAFNVLAETTDLDSDTRLLLIGELARAAGEDGMIGGQVMDIYADTAMSLDDVQTLHRKKTGALIEYAVRAGGQIGGANTADIQHLAEFAKALGLAFQVRDDILDAEGDAQTLGKNVQKDAALGKATFVSTYGLDGAKDFMSELGEQAKVALVPFGGRADKLLACVDFVLERKN